MKSLFKITMLFGLTILFTNCGSVDKKDQTEERIENVKVSLVERGNVSREINLSTVLEGYETVNISPSVTGIIEHIYVEVGSRIQKGDLLVRMDQTQLKTTKLNVANVANDYERVKILRETGTVSQQAYDQAKLGYEQTKENLEFLQANTFFRAPINGVISAKNYEDGELYNGSPILTLVQTNFLKALISIPESYVPLVKEGMKVEVSTDIYPNEKFSATIETVYPTIDPDTHSFQVKLKIPNTDNRLRSGMYVSSSLNLGEVEALMVPYQSVLRLTGTNERYLFLDDNGVAKRVRVKTGKRFDSMIEIVSDDIKVGDKLVTLGQARLVDGVKLNVLD